VSHAIINDDELSVLWTLAEKSVPYGLSYGTVRDYCEGYDTIRNLATYSNDLKDQQRFWMLKTIIATQPRGATLVEIGAGEPAVADILGRLGYRVIVVDPYAGAGNGPQEVEHFKNLYKNVEYIVDLFSAEVSGIEPSSIDCIYSISVIEHIPREVIASVVDGIKLFAKSGSLSVHAIDFVLAGPHDVFHAEMLSYFAQLLGFGTESVDEMLKAAAQDSETYFLSAEAHNRWRGAVSYDEFPMRKVISAQVIAER